MPTLTRRDFAGLSFGGLAAIYVPPRAVAAQCVVGQQLSLPNTLAVDCASRKNFRLFRRYPTYLGLTGVVSMNSADGAGSSYRAGSLLLFPWLKPQGIALRHAVFDAARPSGLSTSTPTAPIPGSALPQDEYLCRFVLRAPWQSFIGFLVDTPLTFDQTSSGWCSNIPQLADGQGVGVDWTSSNLNRAWFGGSNVIPDSAACHGDAWRALIAEGLNQVSTEAC